MQLCYGEALSGARTKRFCPKAPEKIYKARAAHGLKGSGGFINSMRRSPKVIFSKQKVKEKDREYSNSYRERSGARKL